MARHLMATSDGYIAANAASRGFILAWRDIAPYGIACVTVIIHPLEGSKGAEVRTRAGCTTNTLEIEQAITELVEQPFDPVEFPSGKGETS